MPRSPKRASSRKQRFTPDFQPPETNPGLPVKTYERCRAADMGEVLQRVRAELGEHFDDYVIVVRRRSPQSFSWAMSDPEWASGAMDRVLRKVIG